MSRGMIFKYSSPIKRSIAVDKIIVIFYIYLFIFTMDAKVHNFQSHLHKWVTQPKKNPYKHYSIYRAIDCAK